MSKTVTDWLITFYQGENGAYRVRYPGKLSLWQRLCVRLAGWKVEPR